MGKNKIKVFLVQPPSTIGIWGKENKCDINFNFFFFFLSFWPRPAATASSLPRCQSEGASEGAAEEEKGKCPKFQCNCSHNGREKINGRKFSVIAIPWQKKSFASLKHFEPGATWQCHQCPWRWGGFSADFMERGKCFALGRI